MCDECVKEKNIENPTDIQIHLHPSSVVYRGYYTAVRRYEFYLRVVKTIFDKRAQ